MAKGPSLLQRYMIPIEHLDYDYIRNCRDVSELEKMMEILKSGEEGFYPDLVKFTEVKLRELDPNCRALRTEIPAKHMSCDERKQINDFIKKIKAKEHEIRCEMKISEKQLNFDDSYPPIRVMPTLQQENIPISTNSKTIKSCDYQNWDKYDADTECLKIDLQEEQNRETCLIKEKFNQKIVEIESEEMILSNLCETERQELANQYRQKGNENFKCSHFSQALSEYTMSLKYFETAAVHNNRALIYLKLKKFHEAINDCDECLSLDPLNVKAMLRKCDAMIAINKKNDAYKIYSQILQIDPNNAVAKATMSNLSIRLNIQDINNESHETTKLDDDDDVKQSTIEQTINFDDLPQLIVPKKIVQSKLTSAMENMKRNVQTMKNSKIASINYSTTH